MSMEGRTDNCSEHYLHFQHPWWSYFARSQGWRCGYVQEGRYFARSQRWRCGYVQEGRYFARSQGWRCDVYRLSVYLHIFV